MGEGDISLSQLLRPFGQAGPSVSRTTDADDQYSLAISLTRNAMGVPVLSGGFDVEHSSNALRDDGSSRTLTPGWKSIHWPTLAGGAMIGIVMMQLLIARPLTQRIDAMQQQMSAVDSHLVELTGSRDDVQRTNDLLSGLRAQHDQFVAAQQTVLRLKNLQQEIETEAGQVGSSMETLQQLAQLQHTLNSTRTDFESASTSLETVVALAGRVRDLGETVPAQTATLDTAKTAVVHFGQFANQTIEQGKTIQPATAALGQLAQVRDQAISTGQKTDTALQAISGLATVTQAAVSAGEKTDVAVASIQGLGDLQSAVIAQLDQTTQARAQLAEMATVQQSLIDQDATTASAGHAVTALTNLKAQIADGVPGIEMAQTNANQLVVLNQTLNTQTQVDAAQKNLTGLIQIEQSLAGQSQQIVDSVESLQLLIGLQGEFNDQMAKLEEIQRGFTELLLMESAIGRAVKMVQPLAELGNLRRNNEPEIRAAAREIINRRELRMVEENSKYKGSTGEYNPPDRPMPTPPADLD